MLRLTTSENEPSIASLADMIGAQIEAIDPARREQPDPIRQFERTQERMRAKQFLSLLVNGQRMCRIDLAGELLPRAAPTSRFDRALRLAILDARFSACMANDIGCHMTPADCVSANTNVTAPTVRRELKLLETTELVRLVPDPSDHRRKFVFPTQRYMHAFFRSCLTKMLLDYGLAYDTDRLVATTIEARWLRDFNFDETALAYAREVVQNIYAFSRQINVATEDEIAVFY